MPDLFEYAETAAARGIRTAAENSGDAWTICALEFVRRYLTTHPELFTDDLWSAGLPEPRSPRALGAVLQAAARKRWMEEQRTPAGNIAARPSARSNGQLKRVWKSNLFYK